MRGFVPGVMRAASGSIQMAAMPYGCRQPEPAVSEHTLVRDDSTVFSINNCFMRAPKMP
jgi:hypothetical protein